MRTQAHESELRWFFRESAGDMGQRSNFLAIVARLEGGSMGGEPHFVDTHRLEAAARARRVQCLLLGLSRTHREILCAAFGMDSEYRLLWVMKLCPETREAYTQSRSTRALDEWLLRLCVSAKASGDVERRRVFARIHAAADKSLGDALNAYAKHASGVLGARAG